MTIFGESAGSFSVDTLVRNSVKILNKKFDVELSVIRELNTKILSEKDVQKQMVFSTKQ